MPYNETPLNIAQIDAICNFLGCYAEIDGDRMFAQLFCTITGDHLGTAKIA